MLKESQERVVLLEQELDHLKQEIDTLRQRLEEDGYVFAELEQSMSETEADFNKQLESTNSQLNLLLKEKEQLQQQVDSKNTNLTELESKIEQKTSKFA